MSAKVVASVEVMVEAQRAVAEAGEDAATVDKPEKAVVKRRPKQKKKVVLLREAQQLRIMILYQSQILQGSTQTINSQTKTTTEAKLMKKNGHKSQNSRSAGAGCKKREIVFLCGTFSCCEVTQSGWANE